MIPRPAQYLLRFDDLCPTHDHARWQRFPPLLAEFGLKPLLAVVPDNRDPALDVSPPDPGFWAGMQRLHADGAAIGLHGYRHLCVSHGRSLVPLHKDTEFAGVPEEVQQFWIQEGLKTLRFHGLNPTVWVAPRHGFDRATLRALRAEGINTISDGFARRPFLRDGLNWIPQQTWAPQPKSSGLWTICLHSNAATDQQVNELREFLREHAAQFTSVDRILAEFKPTPLSIYERLEASAAMLRIRGRKIFKRLANSS
jgi:hypothetical protein